MGIIRSLNQVFKVVPLRRLYLIFFLEVTGKALGSNEGLKMRLDCLGLHWDSLTRSFGPQNLCLSSITDFEQRIGKLCMQPFDASCDFLHKTIKVSLLCLNFRMRFGSVEELCFCLLILKHFGLLGRSKLFFVQHHLL